jgi:hypothetical protein
VFGPKTKTLVQLEHYLESRTPYRPKPSVGPGWIAGAGILSLAALITYPFYHAAPEICIGLACAAGIAGSRYAFAKKPLPESPTEELMANAEVVADKMRDFATKRRLHLVLHPGVAATLNECAVFWQRIKISSDRKLWEDRSIEPHWQTARADWEAAADLAMAEALLLADRSMLLRPTRPRAEEMVEDLLDTYVFKRPTHNEGPLPATFAPLRELAEKLKILANEVETTTRRLARSEKQEPTADASKRLDQVLGELRSIHEAESELGQDLRT